jgi:VWFA-related protein
MTRVWVAAILAGGIHAVPAADQPVFRAVTELVRIDALVVEGNRPVAGLTADDFEVRDNGVPQRVASVTMTDRVQVGLVLDASGSMTAERMRLARAAVERVVGQLESDDEYELFAFNDQVALIGTSREPPDEVMARLAALRTGGSTALVDAAYAATLHLAASPGPKLLLLVTDGRNNNSFLQVKDAIDAARRHETVIYPVAVEIDRTWMRGTYEQFKNDAVGLLRLLAEASGGQTIEARWDERLAEAVAGILAEYRQRYILTFSPEGVGRDDGWHRIEVKVRGRRATVRARTQYWAGT